MRKNYYKRLQESVKPVPESNCYIDESSGHLVCEIDGDIVEMKLCNHCGEWHPLSDFYKNNASQDGLASWCKDCFKTYVPKSKCPCQEEEIDVEEIAPADDGAEELFEGVFDFIDGLRDKMEGKQEEITRLREENRRLRESQKDLKSLSERDIELILKTYNVAPRILFAAIARQDGRYSFYAYDNETGLKTPIKLDRGVAA